jgi:hypothetical protein
MGKRDFEEEQIVKPKLKTVTRFEERGAHARAGTPDGESRLEPPLSCWALFVKKGCP